MSNEALNEIIAISSRGRYRDGLIQGFLSGIICAVVVIVGTMIVMS